MAGLPLYLIVHDGSETKDADVDIILLAHQAGVLQGPAPRESAVPGGEVAVGERFRSAHHHPDSRLPLSSSRKWGKRSLRHQPRERRCSGAGRSAISLPWNRSLSTATQDSRFIISVQTIQAQWSSKIQQ